MVWFVISALLVYSACEKASVDDQYLTGDKAGGIGSEKDSRAGQFLYFAESLHRRPQQKLAPALGLVQQLLVERSTKDPRRNCIDADTPRGPLDRQRLCERRHRRLACRVRRHFV